ncbi:MAG: SUMF1/EgtB/PvdO family nonheme iron enzyme [Williamsia sp.]|nr:SUMF1/EgtB/PvdO family nonheme iron enzyme [Williamsia sp.]
MKKSSRCLVLFGKHPINMFLVPKGEIVSVVNWRDKPHRNQYRRFSKVTQELKMPHDFFLGETLVSQAVWKEITQTNPSYFKDHTSPVENINFMEVQTFISRLNRLTNHNFRLPTETEWLYACLLNYPADFTQRMDEYVWYEANSKNRTQPVGSKKAGRLQFSDLLGNLFQWCNAAPESPNPSNQPIYRGACWQTQGLWVDTAYRMTVNQHFKNNTIGFRLAMDV